MAVNTALLTFGVDTCQVGFRGQLPPALLEDLQDHAAVAASDTEAPVVRLAGREWRVHRGTKTAAARLKREEITLRFARPGLVNAPEVTAELGCRALWSRGWRECWEDAAGVVSELMGGRLRGALLSRLDVAADLEYAGFEGADHASWVSRAKRTARTRPEGGAPQRKGPATAETFWRCQDPSGWRWGQGGAVVARVYDKAREIREASGKTWFHEVWDREAGAEAWRVEFQLRREFLGKHFTTDPRTGEALRLDTPDGLELGLPSLWAYLAGPPGQHGWLTWCTPEGSQRSRWPVEPAWRVVQSAAGEATQRIVRDDGRAATYKAMLASVRGYVRTMSALCGEHRLEAILDRIGVGVRELDSQDGTTHEDAALARAVELVPLLSARNPDLPNVLRGAARAAVS